MKAINAKLESMKLEMTPFVKIGCSQLIRNFCFRNCKGCKEEIISIPIWKRVQHSGMEYRDKISDIMRDLSE